VRRNEVTVGVVVLLAIVVIIAGTIWLRGSGFGREETTIRARVADAGQLLKGASVKMRGVPIGRVEDVELEERSRGVIVTMNVESDVRLPEDPVVILSPESMFGDWQVQIFPRSSFPLYNYAESPDPNVLPGYTLPDISRLTAVADQIAGNIAELTDRFELAFTEETARNVREAIENIQNVSAQLTGLISRQQRNADEVAANLQTTSEALGDAAETARRAFEQFEIAIGGGRLTGIVSNVQRASAQADSLTIELLRTSRQLRIAAATADTTMRAVGAVASSVSRGQGTLGRLVRDTTLYLNVKGSTAELQALLRDIRENPRRYLNLNIF
jgi:phospholipid/cholesterol/gamma-HCH transport system substrate-binding protein